MKSKTRIKVLMSCYVKAKRNGSSQDILDQMEADIDYWIEKLKESDPDAHRELMREIDESR